jgi:hypothetical protein
VQHHDVVHNSAGRRRPKKNASNAASPPAEAPMTTIGTSALSCACGTGIAVDFGAGAEGDFFEATTFCLFIGRYTFR